jgi:hypothetical protein
MIRALEAIPTPYVLLTLEDFFLRSKVDTGRIKALFDELQKKELRMLRLVPRPGPTTIIVRGCEYGAIAPSAPYRVSTQAAFWHVKTLRMLLVPGETAWEFEINGTKRSENIEGFAAVWRAALPYRHHVIERGKWFPWAAWQFRRLGIGVDLATRPAMTAREAARWILGKMVSGLLNQLPPKYRHALKSFARWAGW